MDDVAFDCRIAAVRRFNRFYTQRIGVLREGLLDSPFALAEARVLYELAQRDEVTATRLAGELGLDAGYLSRILNGFDKRGLIERKPSPSDRRQRLISLTADGRAAFAPLDRRSKAEIGDLLAALPPAEQIRLVAAMRRVATALGGRSERSAVYRLRAHRPGDIGWITHRHGVLYAEEYGWDERFEGFVADIAARFIANFDAEREHCWVVEQEGETVGSVALVNGGERVAKLRLLLVEPPARGLGIGARLVDECVRFARHAGYEAVTLSTYSVLVAARRLYQAAGFRLAAQQPERSFGHDLIGERWELRL